MPKQKPIVSDEQLQGAALDTHRPDTPLLASQAGALLGRGKTRMDGDRRDGRPPPFYKDRSKVLYRLGDVLAERARQQSKTPEQSAREEADRVRGYPTFAGFMEVATADATWPIATVRGRPMDFFATIGMELEDDEFGEVRAMGFKEFADCLAEFAAEMEAAAVRSQLQESTTPADTNLSRCPKCGRPGCDGSSCRL